MDVQLYIENQRVDLFGDESISITQNIKNVKDIAKSYANFTKSFTLPASKTNNKIFKHYYNYNIVDGFDARKRVDAFIEINNSPFDNGKLKLEGVDMKNNKPSLYRVTFYGKAIDLKDIFGEDKLQVLSPLNTNSFFYNATNISAKLQSVVSSNDVIAPLITHTDRLYYDSSVTGGTDGNLYYDVGSPLQGVLWTQLKPAIRLHTIVEAIEDYYNITFSNDFLDSSQSDYYNLYMWMHRKKGDVGNGTQIPTFPYLVSDWSNSVGFTGASIEYTEELIIPQSLVDDKLFDYALEFNTISATEYSIEISKNGVYFWSTTGLTGNNTFDSLDFTMTAGTYTVTITSTAAITFTKCEWTISDTSFTDNFDTGTFSTSANFNFEITSQIPEIKVIDFITGLFKMFNLVVQVNDVGVYVVKTLDDFYSSGVDYDITNYVSVEKSSVYVALPYSEIIFKYNDTGSFFSEQHEKLFNYQWGTEEYNGNDVLFGGNYTVEVPFNHSKYERLIDLNTSTNTDVQWGWFADDNEDSYIGSPLVFYPIRISGNSISYRDSLTTNQSISNYIIPSNSLSVSSASQNINFKQEQNEYNSTVTYEDTLFKTYYSDYIGDVFNQQNRITKVTAYLPLKVLLNYTLADRFIISDRKYKINSITTNLLTGKSELELLNEL